MRNLIVIGLTAAIASLCILVGDARAQANPATDRAALEALYNATNGPSWTDSTNWLSAAPLSDWHGVEIDANDRVSGLFLSSNGLTGSLPPAFGQLTNLTRLFLDGNGLTGSIPPTIGDLTSLNLLVLSRNQLSGPIPPALGSLVNLESLELSDNQLTGTIPTWLGGMIGLQSLSLGGNRLTGPIPPALRQLTNLKWLSLSGNQLTGPIPSELGNLVNVRRLVLNVNQLTGPIPSTFGSLASLETLLLSDNQLTGPIPSELGNLANLKGLHLDDNQLTGSIPPALGQMANLEWLGLEENQLAGVIPPDLGGLVNLRILNLASNGQLAGRLPQSLMGLSALTFLSISETGVCVPTDAAFLAWLATIHFASTDLVCGGVAVTVVFDAARYTAPEGSPITVTVRLSEKPGQAVTIALTSTPGAGATAADYEKIPVSVTFGATETEQAFVFTSVPDDDPDDGEIVTLGFGRPLPARVTPGDPSTARVTLIDGAGLAGDRAALEALYDATDGPNWVNNTNWLSNEPLSTWYGVGVDSGGTGRVVTLRLTRNRLTGPIPPELGTLGAIELLVVDENRLTGPIPSDLGSLANLTALDLGSNALTGSIPSELGNLVNLRNLSLASNQLTGGIPPALANLPRLYGLALEFNNDLSGMFPLRLLQSPSLVWVDLHATKVCVPQADDAFEEHLARLRLHRSGLACGRPAPTVSEIDVAVFYTPAARREVGATAAIEAEIDLVIAETNQAYRDSGVNQRVALAAREELQYTETNSSHDDLANLANMERVRTTRDGVGADLVHLIKVYVGDEVAGIANLAPRAEGGFSLSSLFEGRASSRTFAHELGHNMGLHHDRYVNRRNYPYPYGHGYVNQRAFAPGAPPSAGWRTIMAYFDQCSGAGIGCRSLLRFSNPNQTWDGDPLGVPGDTPSLRLDGPSDAVRTLNNTRHSVAAFRKGALDRYYETWRVLRDGGAPSSGAASTHASVVGERATVSEVAGATTFTEHPISPGKTPLRVSHFRELRARVADLRAGAGLPAVRWTDPSLTAGVTPVKRVHLTELRAALDAAYDAAGRPRPSYTDAAVTAGVTAIKAVHLMELRAAVSALDAAARVEQRAARPPPAGGEVRHRERILEVEGRSGGLFAVVDSQAGARRAPNTLPDDITLRRRLVAVDIGTIERAAAGVIQQAQPMALTLNLFDDVTFTGIVEQRIPTFSGGYALSGRIEGFALGTMTLVVNGSVVAGTVRTPFATYRIHPAGGSHAVSQIDPSKLPKGGEPLMAERPGG